ncbi:hypothetical protein U2F26_03270 [Micromonospora sp. 4G57]|uniref:Phage major capsid protein n=1 Tax=Micromonospora sicca TaxID=2202420 RepID=A0ABU5JCN7_9ACTN|nr:MULTISPECIES: hypothetical protein [unclassified Micromonospora]MDZ5441752.1 hypothetical protein [Micromonospora sp. 4G57]MDZ5490313.1 hypothetical protein [Micromonospora sp. 4G53]
MTDHIGQLRSLALAALATDASDAIRSSRARETVEQVHDLADFARFAAGVIGGSRAQDWARVKVPHLGGPGGQDVRPALERIEARQVADQLRAIQLTTDNPGLVGKPVEAVGGTGIGTALPLIRQYAAGRDFTAGGTAPVVPGVASGNINGAMVTEGTPLTAGTAVTIGDVGSGRARQLAACYAVLPRQVIDWADPLAQAMLDQLLQDVADRAAEIYVGGQLVAAAGGTRGAGADAITLGAALDQAEALAGAAMNNHLANDPEGVADGAVPGLLICNPANLPRVRRAISTSWQPDVPHPVVAVSVGAPVGTAIVTAPGAVLLEREPVQWDPQLSPDTLGVEIGVSRPLYLAVRATAGVQTVTGIPAA